MTDVDHELGALRFVVESSLSSKVAMFNNVASQHKDSQLLNPFSNTDGLPPRRPFNKDEYGKPIAGSLTEMRGIKANMHVCKEMLQLCQVIDSEGFAIEGEPDLKVIRFGDLFNIYTLISDKVVGLLLRARKYKLIEFEGEVLFQRRDDDVPIFLLKSLEEIKRILEEKQDEFRRSVSPSPQPDSRNASRCSSPAPPSLNRGLSPTPQSRENSPAPQSRGSSPTPVSASNQKNSSRGSSPVIETNRNINSSPSAINNESGNQNSVKQNQEGIANNVEGKIEKSHIIPTVRVDRSESISDVTKTEA